MALVGFSGSGKSTLAQCLVQLYRYTGGKILLDGHEVSRLSKTDVVRGTGFVSQSPFIFEGSIEENLLYSVRAEAEQEPTGGNAEMPGLDDRILVLQQTGLFVDVLRFGLNAVLDRDKHRETLEQILDVRRTFRSDFGDDLADYIEFYDPDKYLYNSSVAENILFGDPLDENFHTGNLPRNPLFDPLLREAKLDRPLLDSGVAFIEELIRFLEGRPPEQDPSDFSPIDPEEIDDYKRFLHRVKKKGPQKISGKDRIRILGVMLEYTPGKHRFFDLPPELETGVLKARKLFKKKIESEQPDAVSFCQMSNYMINQSILTNIFFGKLKDDSAAAQDKVNTCIHQLLVKEDFLEDIIELGMQHPVGTKGDHLSGGQRQKLAIARVFLKKPPILIMDEATSGLDNDSQARIQNLLENHWKGRSTLIAVLHRLDIVKNYDRIAVMKSGRIVESGAYEELLDKRGTLYDLVNGG